jgi:drug/metabolite transporter (DMT)-like permease
MSIQIGIVLALACAFAANLGFFYKHRGCNEVPAVDVRHPLRSAKALWGSRWFAIGMLLGLIGWVLHVGAIALAPLSTVQVVLSGGVVLIAVMADRIFGFAVDRRQWWGLGLTAVGLGPRAGAPAEHHGVMLAAATGILFGVCNVAVKALTEVVGMDGITAILSPWLVVAVLASATAFYASARSLQDGDAVSVIAITGTAANISCISGGIIVFGDPMPGDAFGIAVQAIAFIMVVVASALTPAPVRSTAAAARGAAATA